MAHNLRENYYLNEISRRRGIVILIPKHLLPVVLLYQRNDESEAIFLFPFFFSSGFFVFNESRTADSRWFQSPGNEHCDVPYGTESLSSVSKP